MKSSASPSERIHQALVGLNLEPAFAKGQILFYNTKNFFKKHNYARDVKKYVEAVDWCFLNNKFHLSARGVITLGFAKQHPKILAIAWMIMELPKAEESAPLRRVTTEDLANIPQTATPLPSSEHVSTLPKHSSLTKTHVQGTDVLSPLSQYQSFAAFGQPQVSLQLPSALPQTLGLVGLSQHQLGVDRDQQNILLQQQTLQLGVQLPRIKSLDSMNPLSLTMPLSEQHLHAHQQLSGPQFQSTQLFQPQPQLHTFGSLSSTLAPLQLQSSLPSDSFSSSLFQPSLKRPASSDFEARGREKRERLDPAELSIAQLLSSDVGERAVLQSSPIRVTSSV